MHQLKKEEAVRIRRSIKGHWAAFQHLKGLVLLDWQFACQRVFHIPKSIVHI